MDENTTPPLSVYVSGATTGLGRFIVQQLAARGHKVAGTANSSDDARAIRADGGLPVYNDQLRASELASTLKMLKADGVVNAGTQWINTLPFHKPDWDYARRLLSEGAPALAQAAHQAGAKFVVHLSYAFIYGDTHGDLADESHPINTEPALFDAADQAERAVLNGSVPGCVLRAGYNYGPGGQTIVALRQALISKGSVTVGSHPASWIHSADLANAIALVLEQQPGGEIFNIADDNPISPVDFVDQLADKLGVAHPAKMNLPVSLRQAMMPADERALLETSVKASAAKAKANLGWTPVYPTSAAGIDQTLLAWRADAAV
jgi:nucleoside-diphosphate-sugar epimerase